MTEFVDDELPLPPFAEMFGEGPMSNKKKKQKMAGSRSDGLTGEESTGRWTPDEHRLFLEGIMLYGKDWKKMQPLIKTRTLVQIRTHAQKVFKKIGLKKMNLKKNGPMEVTAAQIALLQQHLEAEDNVSMAGMRNVHAAQHGSSSSSNSSSSVMAAHPPQGSYSSASMMMPISTPGGPHSAMQANLHHQQQQHQQQHPQQQEQQQHQMHAMSQHLTHSQQNDSLVGPPHLNSSMIPDGSGGNGNSTVGIMGSQLAPYGSSGSNGSNSNVNQGPASVYSAMHYSQQQHLQQPQHVTNGNGSSNGSGAAYSQLGGYGSYHSGAMAGVAGNTRQVQLQEGDDDEDDDLAGVDDEDEEDEGEDEGDDADLNEADRHELLSLVNHSNNSVAAVPPSGAAGGQYLYQQQQQQQYQHHQNPYNHSSR